MNGLLKNALKALQKHYSRILLINRKMDTYYPIVIEENETRWDTIGKLSDFSKWFLKNGNIYKADKPLFENFIKECFVDGKDRYLFYRRKCGDEYRWAYCFIEKGDNPEKPDEEYLYVRDCNEIYIEQCDLILDNVGYIDPLTGLKNRLAFNEDKCDDDTVTFIVIPNLAEINEKCGYDMGNELISRVAAIIEDLTENAYRISGSKFAILNTCNNNKIQNALKGLAIVQ